MIVLADVTPSGLGTQDLQRRHLAEVVVPLAVEHRAEVVLAVIDGAALEAPELRARVSFDTAEAQGNEVAAGDIEDAARRELVAVADEVLATGSGAAASDVAGAVDWAADTLEDTPDGWRGIVLLSDAVSTTAPCNMTLAPPSDAEASVAACFPDGLPDLGGADVYFLGANAYREGEPPPVDPAHLEQFWRAVVERGNGTVRAFGATVLGEPSPAEQGDGHV